MNLLSKIGRTQLITATLANISAYHFNCFLLPKPVLNKIYVLFRNFFWGHDLNHRKIHTINCNKITQPKHLGGLGIRSSIHQNKSCLLKLIWNLQTKPNWLPSKIIMSKYGNYIPSQKIAKSFIYRGIQNSYPLFLTCIKNQMWGMETTITFG